MEPRHILLIEDEIKIADSLSTALTEEGYAVAIAHDGNEGLQLFTKNNYDLIILDISLPGMDGYELCKRIRQTNTHVPVIMLTAFNSINNKLEGYDSGADDYMTKPFDLRELLVKVKVLLRRTSTDPARQNVLKAGDLEMNLDSMEVKRADKQINLTAKEFQLLQYLLEHKNKVLSRADIAMDVWEIDFDTNTNVIDVYINYLRNKVDKGFATRLIQTQVGMGYILKDNQ
jgi:DNA-binding response OmpR family regulator